MGADGSRLATRQQGLSSVLTGSHPRLPFHPQALEGRRFGIRREAQWPLEHDLAAREWQRHARLIPAA